MQEALLHMFRGRLQTDPGMHKGRIYGWAPFHINKVFKCWTTVLGSTNYTEQIHLGNEKPMFSV